MVTTRQLEIIVARYKEDISWLNNIKNIKYKSVYNKFYLENISLPNIGREAHTYLYHIYNNYDNLSEINLFSQGDPIFHCPDFISRVNNLDLDKIRLPYFFGSTGIENCHGNNDSRHPNGLPIYYFLDLLFDKKVSPNDRFTVPYGAIFLVSKEIILHRPKDFYGFLLKFTTNETTPIEAYIIERLWPFIFDINLSLSLKYKNFICTD